MAKKGKRYVIIIFLILVFIAGIICLTKKSIAIIEKQRDLDKFSSEIYQGAFFSMYDISSYPVDNFTYYFGIKIVKADHCVKNMKDINSYLSAVLASDNELTNIYIGLDPLQLWKASEKDIASVRAAFEEKLFPLTDSFPEISFEIFLSHPSMQYWLSLSEEERETAYVLYQQFAQLLDGRENITTFYAGGQAWLIENPKNYTDAFTTIEEVSEFIFLSHYNDYYRINSQNAASMLLETSSLVAENIESPPQYPDLSQWDIVFMGDSIIGNYTGTLSIPGVVNGLSGASVYNCAQGGTSAAEPEPGLLCFPKMAQDFTKGVADDPDSTFGQGVQSYIAADHTKKNLCFVINFGLNDYFGGFAPENADAVCDISTYAGAMRTGIAALKEQYPDALYLIIGPGKVSYFNEGTDLLSETGGQLVDYCNLSAALSLELNIPYIDLYNAFPGDVDNLEDVWVDGCHYNEYGRYLIGIKIVEVLAEQIQ